MASLKEMKRVKDLVKLVGKTILEPVKTASDNLDAKARGDNKNAGWQKDLTKATVKEDYAAQSLMQFISESSENDLTKTYGTPKKDGLSPTVFNFLQHLTSSSIGLTDAEISEHARAILGEAKEDTATPPSAIAEKGRKIEKDKEAAHEEENKARLSRGEKPVAYPGIRQRMKEGFHAAIPEGEHPDVTKQKAKESQEHFRKFMHEEGGHAKNNKLELMGQNGKTSSSTGAGQNTIGLSITPASGKRSGEKVKGEFDSCPNSTAECRKGCLGYTAGGNNQYKDASDRAKELRKRYLIEHPEHAARLMSHEIGQNEKFCKEHNTIHHSDGSIVGYKNLKTGKVKSEVKGKSDEDVKKGLESGEHHERPLKSGVRLNVTSDIQHHRLHPKAFFERHKDSDFYDYTKNHGSLDDEDKPKNYTHGLSHTGDSHSESNSHEVIKHLRKGGISAMVYQRGADQPKAKRVKVHGSPEGQDEWKVVNGDDDDNLHTRHESAAQEHDALAKHHREVAHASANSTPAISAAHHEEADKHEKIASEYRAKKHGVVSGLALKGITNDKAGHFANKVDHTGTIWLHDHGPQAHLRRAIPISKG